MILPLLIILIIHWSRGRRCTECFEQLKLIRGCALYLLAGWCDSGSLQAQVVALHVCTHSDAIMFLSSLAAGWDGWFLSVPAKCFHIISIGQLTLWMMSILSSGYRK